MPGQLVTINERVLKFFPLNFISVSVHFEANAGLILQELTFFFKKKNHYEFLQCVSARRE